MSTPGFLLQVCSDRGFLYTFPTRRSSDLLTFTVSALQTGYKYRAVFNNSCGSAMSNAATLTVNNVPSITIEPKDEEKCAAAMLSFSTAVNERETPGVQWQVSTDGGCTYND